MWKLVRTRLLSFGMVLGFAFLLIVSLLFSAALSAFGKWYGGFFGSWEVLARFVDVVVGFGLTTTAFALIYKFMPRVQVGWADVWVGALVTAALFTLGRFLIGLYIGRAGVASDFGAAAGVVIVFIWVYYSAQIFLLGAEFTWAYAETFGSRRSLGESADNTAGSRPVPDRDVGASDVSAVGSSVAGEACEPGKASDGPPGLVAQPRHVLWAMAAGFLGMTLYRRSRRQRAVPEITVS